MASSSGFPLAESPVVAVQYVAFYLLARLSFFALKKPFPLLLSERIASLAGTSS